jgi:hypothetical protein
VLISVRRFAPFEPCVDALKMFERRRRRIVEISIDGRVAENLEHGARVSHNERLENKPGGAKGLHAL